MRRVSSFFAIGLFTAGLAFAALPAAAQTVGIQGFYGSYKGSAIAKNRDSAYFGVTLRDLDVVIEKAGAGGFKLTWTTVIRRGGKPGAGKRTTNSITFVSGGRPNVWHGEGANNPETIPGYVWARIAGRTLSVYRMHVGRGGRYTLEIYRRTLIAGGMKLEFRRQREGAAVRIVTGTLNRNR